MKTKLFISTLILWIVNTFVYYLFCYPESYPLLDIMTQHVEWKPLLSIYFILISIIAFFSFFLYKKISFSKKFIQSIIYINVFTTILSLSYGLYRFYNNKKELDQSILLFQQEAYQDIKKDKIRVFGSGLVLPPKNPIDFAKQKKETLLRKNMV